MSSTVNCTIHHTNENITTGVEAMKNTIDRHLLFTVAFFCESNTAVRYNSDLHLEVMDHQ